MIINKKLPRLISVISSRVLSLKFISYLKVIDFRSFIFSVALPLLLLLLLLLSIWRIEWSLADVMIYTAHAIGCSHSSISSSSISTKQEWYWMIDSVVGAGARPPSVWLSLCPVGIPWFTKGHHAMRPSYGVDWDLYILISNSKTLIGLRQHGSITNQQTFGIY